MWVLKTLSGHKNRRLWRLHGHLPFDAPSDAACTEGPCLPGLKVYENDFLTGLFDTPDTGTIWGDDLVFGPGLPCDLLAYDITMVGAGGSPDFDVHVELWTNDDRGTPSDEQDDIPLAQITGTLGGFTGVPADQLAHMLLAGPFDGIPLPEMVWMVFSTSSDQAGPLLAGMANTGFSRDAFAIFNAPGNPGVWRENFSFGGFNPTGCPGDAECNPAGSFQINVWCAGEEPTGACGNGSVEPGEECDGMDDNACPGACLSDCTCGPFCGNGACDPGEDSCNCPDDCGTPPSNEVPGATCADGNDNDCDGLTDSADPDCAAIPTVSTWGLIVMALLLLTGIKVKFGGRQPQRG